MRARKIGHLSVGVLAALVASTGALAQNQAITQNHAAVGWFSNQPVGTYGPAGGGVAYPQDADASPVQYDTRLILPGLLTVNGLTAYGTQSFLTFSGLPDSPPSLGANYVAYPFKTGVQPDADILINQATYSLNNNGYGQNFNVTATLVDVDSGGTEYPLSENVTLQQVYDPGFAGFQFINNQQWPMTPSTPHFPGSAYKLPVPLKPNHSYELRTYLSRNVAGGDDRGMMDDFTIYMQAVTVDAQNDANVNLPANAGGDAPSVLTNDTMFGVAVDTTALPTARNYTVTPVGTLPAGVTLQSNGVIHVNAGQPQTYSIPYSLCPKYGDNLFGSTFQSNACKTATALVTLVGAPLPPTVSVSCTPATIADSQGAASVCTISADTVVTNPLSVKLTPPATNSRYQSDCASPIVIPGGSNQATCNVTAVPNDVPGDGSATATITLVADAAYTIGTGTASVDVQDDDLSIFGSVQGAPATFPPALVGQTVNYSLTCAPGAATPASGQLTIGAAGQLSAPATHVPPGTSCTSMTVDGVAQLPAAPANYEWKSSTATLSGANAFAVTLVLAPKAQPVTDATPVPTLNSIGLALLSLLAAGFGAFVLRRKTMS